MTGKHLYLFAGRHMAADQPRQVSPAFPGVSTPEDAMTTDDGKVTAGIPLPERYRSLFYSLAGVLTAAVMVIADALSTGRPLGGVEFVSLVVAVATAAAVYFPGNPYAKIAAGFVGAVAQAFTSALTDNIITGAEWSLIAVMAFGALKVALEPNARIVEGEVVESPVPTRVETTTGLPASGGSTYVPPSQFGPTD